MNVLCAFRSTHPDVRAADAENRQRLEAWRAAVYAWAGQYPDHHPVQVTFGGGADRSIHGLTGEGSPGEGWRLSKKSGDWVADKRTRAGREIAAAMEPLKVGGLKHLPGMPDMAAMQSPGVYDLQGATWVAWSCPVNEVAKGGWSNVELDLTMWTEMPLSAFYLAVEAEEAQQ